MSSLGSMMLDLVPPPIIDRLVGTVTAYLSDLYELHSNDKKEPENLKNALEKVQFVARAADEVEIDKYNNLEPWLRELKEAAYEAEGVLGEFEYRRPEQEVAAADKDDRRSKVSSFLSRPVKRLKISTRPSESLKRLKSIQQTLEKLADRTLDFHQLLKTVPGQPRQGDHSKHRETTSFAAEPVFVGRTVELEEIVNRLVVVVGDGSVSSGSVGEVPVVPVVGHGGFGKTTVAQHVFSDPRVVDYFEKRVWVHVGQDFHLPTLTKKMIESATGNSCSGIESLQLLQQKLVDALRSKRFLLVLDDVWFGPNTKEEWKKLCAPLAAAAAAAEGKGSKILLTSPTPEVADLPGASTPIPLEELARDDCWSIIQRSVFGGENIPDGCQDLEVIGKQIADKVGGSPLAAKVVGRMLHDKPKDTEYWRKILNTNSIVTEEVVEGFRL